MAKGEHWTQEEDLLLINWWHEWPAYKTAAEFDRTYSLPRHLHRSQNALRVRRAYLGLTRGVVVPFAPKQEYTFDSKEDEAVIENMCERINAHIKAQARRLMVERIINFLSWALVYAMIFASAFVLTTELLKYL